MAKTSKHLEKSKSRKNRHGNEHQRQGVPNTEYSDGDGNRSRMEWALLYAAEGLPVVPLHGKNKDGGCTCGVSGCLQLGRHPRTKLGLEDASTERLLIEKRWAEWPQARAGVALGTQSRVLALVSEGAAGKQSLRKLLEHDEALKKTVTIRDGEFLTRLFRTPDGCTVHHRELGNGLTILGDGDLVVMPSRIGLANPGFVSGRALGKVKIAEAPKWLLDQRQVARVLEVDEIKIADVLIGENRRSLNPEKVAEIADSIVMIGQTTPITVRRTEDGKLVLVKGLHRLRATSSLGRTHIRAEIMEADDIEARLWEIAGLLHRANLTAFEEAERVAEWVRLTEGREPVSGQKVQKSGRPEGGIAKAARRLPVKGKTQDARRKRIERAIKIAAISSEAKAAIRKAGLDEHHSALCQVANQKGRKAQVAKVEEIAAHKAGAQQRPTRSTAKKKGTSAATQATYNAPSARSESMDIPAAADSPSTAPEIDAEDDAARAEIEQLKAELAEKTENLREAQEELRQARFAAARVPERAVTSPLRSAPSDDDLEIPAMLDRCPLSGEDQATLTSLVAAWNNAPELQRAFANASAIVRERFIAEVLRGNRQGNSERQV